MADMTKFADLIRQFAELFDRLIPLEQEKLDIVKQNQVSALEDIIKREQAEIMTLRGLDQKRERLQKELGFPDMTFSEILERVSGDEKTELQKLFEELGSRVRQFRSITESSKTMMEVNLHAINKMVTQKTYGSANVRTYEGDGSMRPDTPHFTDRRI